MKVANVERAAKTAHNLARIETILRRPAYLEAAYILAFEETARIGADEMRSLLEASRQRHLDELAALGVEM
jgi:hypothetical protein